VIAVTEQQAELTAKKILLFSVAVKLGEHMRVKEKDFGYPKLEHILALAANAFER